MTVVGDYEGRAVRLTDERWAHISEHPEMSNMRAAIEETLAGPEVVVQSPSEPRARLYYRFYHRTLVGGKYLCAVVLAKDADAFVVTAYLTDRVKRGLILWHRKP
jgi:hypothetical protein